MSARIVTVAVTFILLSLFMVFLIELFIPISMNSDFRHECHNAMIIIEANGGIDQDIKNDLKTKLEGEGFEEIVITGDENVKFGEEANFSVEASMTLSKIIGVFRREEQKYKMEFQKEYYVRKVTN